MCVFCVWRHRDSHEVLETLGLDVHGKAVHNVFRGLYFSLYVSTFFVEIDRGSHAHSLGAELPTTWTIIEHTNNALNTPITH